MIRLATTEQVKTIETLAPAADFAQIKKHVDNGWLEYVQAVQIIAKYHAYASTKKRPARRYSRKPMTGKATPAQKRFLAKLIREDMGVSTTFGFHRLNLNTLTKAQASDAISTLKTELYG